MSKFTINRSELIAALTTSGKAINANAIIPALTNYLFRINPESLEVCGSNNEIFISKTVPCSGDYTGEIQIPSARMQFIKDLPEHPLEFEISDKSITIIASTGEYVIPYEAGKDFPVMISENSECFTMPGYDINLGILKTIFAVHTDQTLPFAGIKIETGENGIKFAATNASYLSAIEFPGEYPSHDILASSKLAAVLTGLKLDGEIQVSISNANIHLVLSDNVSVTAVLMDMKYPDYNQILPKNNDKSLTINREMLIGSLKRTVQFSDEVIKTVAFSLNTMVTLTAKNRVGEAAKEVLLAGYEGEPLEINLNGIFALACLSRLDGTDVTMTFSTPKRAVLITEKNNTMLVMPYAL